MRLPSFRSRHRQPGKAPAQQRADQAFTILESLLMLVLLTVFSMVCAALWIKAPAGVDEDELKWRSEGGDAMKLTPGLPAIDDPDLVPEMTSDTEIRLEKEAPAKEDR
jgi:hypothetical protein